MRDRRSMPSSEGWIIVASESDECGEAAARGRHFVRYEHASFALQGLDGSMVVFASGEIDLATSSGLRDALLTAAESSSRVVVDLSAVTFLDMSGVGVLIGFKKLSNGGSMGQVPGSGVALRDPAGVRR